MILRLSLKNIICISLLISQLTFAQIIFVPFNNNTDYEGKWDLSQEVPNFMAAYFRELQGTQVLSATAFTSMAADQGYAKAHLHDLDIIASFGKKLDVGYTIFGRINEFSISRFSAGDPLTAGYESYLCEISLTVQLADLTSGSIIYTSTVKKDFRSNGLGLNILGKPSDDKKQFFALNEIKFGSEEFSETIVGKTMLLVCEEIVADISQNSVAKKAFTSSDKTITELPDKSLEEITINTEIKRGKIISYDPSTGEAFINLGSFDTKVGDRLSVYAEADSLFDPGTGEYLGLSDKKVATLEIVEVRGERLSLAIIQDNREAVSAGMEIRRITLYKRQ